MTQRKPGSVSWDDWIEGQIRRAQNEGGFDALPGAGKPIADLADTDQMVWLAKKLKAEGVEPQFYLPPQLALAREIEDIPARLARLRSEPAVREYLQDVNRRVSALHAAPPEGPPVRVKLVDVEGLTALWRAARDSAAEHTARRDEPASPPPRRWWRRGRSA